LSAGSDTPQGDDDEVIQPVTVSGQHVVDSLGQRVKGCVVAQTQEDDPLMGLSQPEHHAGLRLISSTTLDYCSTLW
jgi:hypothetical protein